MNKDLKSNISICPIIDPVAYTATTTSDLVDTQGFESCVLMVSVGAQTFSATNKITVTVEECDTTADASFTTVAAADLIGSFSVWNGTDADQNEVQKVGYIGSKRYVRVVLTEGGTVSTVVSAYGILGNARHKVEDDLAVTAAT